MSGRLPACATEPLLTQCLRKLRTAPKNFSTNGSLHLKNVVSKARFWTNYWLSFPPHLKLLLDDAKHFPIRFGNIILKQRFCCTTEWVSWVTPAVLWKPQDNVVEAAHSCHLHPYHMKDVTIWKKKDTKRLKNGLPSWCLLWFNDQHVMFDFDRGNVFLFCFSVFTLSAFCSQRLIFQR